MLKPRKELIGLKTYNTALYPCNWDMKLDSNENYIGPSSEVLKVIRNFTPEQISHYPSYGKCYNILSEKLEVNKSCIAITNGADEAISAIINTYLTPSDSVVTVCPTFSMPQIYTAVVGAEYIEVPYREKWVYPFEDVIDSVSENTRIILVTSPNNPTGDIVPLEQIIELLKRFPDKAVVVDETYSGYAGISNVCLTQKYDNLIVIKSFSKDYALAGLRFGCIISDVNNIENIKRVLHPYNVNTIAAEAACAAICDNKYIEIVKKEIEASKKYLIDKIKEMDFTPYNSFANFILVDFGKSCELIYEKLKSNGISVKSFDDSTKLKNFLRITVPTLSASRKLVNIIKSKDTLVFDMDGVLVDVRQSYYEAVRYTYNYFTGKELTQQEILDAKKQGGLNNDWDLTYHLIKKYGFNFAYEDIVSVFQKHYWNDGNGSINNESLLIDKNLLEILKSKYNLTIFTGRPRVEAYFTLKKFEIEEYFQKIVTMDDLPKDKQKPHPEGLGLIKSAMLTDELIYFGDTVDDMTCAATFGAYGVGVLQNDNSEVMSNLLLKSGAKRVIKSINELCTILENVNETC